MEMLACSYAKEVLSHLIYLNLIRSTQLSKWLEDLTLSQLEFPEWFWAECSAHPRVAGSVVSLLGYETRGLFAFSASGTV